MFDKEQVKAAQKDPLLEEKLAVRRWDDQAKVPGAKCPELDSYATLATSCLLSK
jgi:predicted HD phosphohydrolase